MQNIRLDRSISNRYVLVCASLLFFFIQVQAQKKSLTPEMVVNLKQVAQVAISPDGKTVAYVTSVPRSEDEEVGRNHLEISLIPSSGGTPTRYTSKPVNAWAVSWKPDGRHITFLSRRTELNENTQVYMMPVDGGEATTLTNHRTSIGSYRWSPDGKWLAFTARDPQSDEEKVAEKKGKDWIVPDEDFQHTRLWIWNVGTGDCRVLYKNEMTVWSYIWSPDSKTLAFQATKTPLIDDSYMYKRIYTVPASGGEPTMLCETEGKLGNMAYSPDGSMLAFAGAVSLNDPLSQNVFVVDAQGGTPRNLTPGYLGSANSVGWIDDNTIFMLAHEGSLSALQKIDAGSGKMEALGVDNLILSSVDANPETGSFAAVVNSPQHPNEAYIGSLKGGKLRRLTSHNPELAEVELARQEVVEWKGPDNKTIAGVLTYPKDYREGIRYPLVLQIHGGPEGVSLNGWTTRPEYPVQNIAAEGYFVLEPNYRGSGGKGVAFSKADHDDLGGKEFGDVLAGIDALVERGLVDNERVGTGGWSYGGYFSAWAATRHSERFRASVVAAGISNWISFSGTTDIPHEMALVHWNSYWYQARDLHWQRSPLYHIKNAETPTMVVHGMKDDRVHPGQGIELYTALKHLGVPTKLVLYPREPHGLTERAHELDFIKRALGWYNRYVKNIGTN